MKKATRLVPFVIIGCIPIGIFLLIRGLTLVSPNPLPAIPISGSAHQQSMLEPWAYLPVINGAPNPSIANCPTFPADNIWNTPVDSLPVHARSADYIKSIGSTATFHADFGSGLWDGAPIGIPYVVVPASQREVGIHYTAYGDESDQGPFPVPTSAPIEGGRTSDGDRHVLVLESGSCTLYELYRAFPLANGDWNADSGAHYHLTANGPLRPAGWTSADAAGLPILPGLARYDEVAAGEIRHALRFTAPCTQNTYVWPARHKAGSCGSAYPPMGQRFRLKASFNISAAPLQTRVILRAMQKYGIILADNGSPWYITGAPDSQWNNDQLHWLDDHLSGSAFEAVDTTSLMIDPNSGQAKQP